LFRSQGIQGDAKCFSPQDVEDARLPLVHDVESNEVIALIPYLSPELIAAILQRESISAIDVQADSKSATEKSFPAPRSRSAVNEKPVRVSLRRRHPVCDALVYLLSWVDW
jgi:hypothetical protein